MRKIFSRGLFLDSDLGRRPSFAWRSIWNASPSGFDLEGW
jgi:hypothetical protein